MKKYILIFTITCGLMTTGVFAQEKKSRPDVEQKMEERMAKLEKELELTPEQSAKIREINKDFYAKQKALKEQMHEIRSAKREAYKQVLTPEQQEKMKEIHQKKKSERKEKCCEKSHEQKGEQQKPKK